MKTLVVTLKDGAIISGEKDSPILNTINVHDIETLTWKPEQIYTPHFAFKPNPNYHKKTIV